MDSGLAVTGERKWKGIGKWFAAAGAILLLLTAIPFVFVEGQGASAGWSIFMGLFLLAAIFTNHRHAASAAAAIALLLIIRIAMLAALGGEPIDYAISGIPALATMIGAWDLRRQARLTT